MSKLVGELTQQQLKERHQIHPGMRAFPVDGELPRKEAGTVVCSPTTGKYTYISIYGKRYPAHRLAWLYIYGEWPPDQIDHIDGEPSNNRLDNLRLATNSENQQNRKIASNNTSGAKGVCKIGNRFKAHIGVRER